MSSSRLAKPVVGGGEKPVVVHVTESFGGGVAGAIVDYARQLPQLEHHLLYVDRADAPVDERQLAEFAASHRLGGGHVQRVREVRRYIQRHHPRIVHAHSSFGGLYSRVAARKSDQLRIVYTPHCYAFERSDIGVVARCAYRVVEGFLSLNTSAVAACSVREQRLSEALVGRAPAVYVPNVFSRAQSDRRVADATDDSSRPSSLLRVVGIGRLAAQKDPKFFADCIDALRQEGFLIEAEWIGGGTPEAEEKLEARGVHVAGWGPREHVEARLARADVYVHSAAWEGFPLSILEASSFGIATIVREAPWTRGAGFPLTVKQPSDIRRAWRHVISSDGRTIAVDRMRDVLSGNDAASQRQALLSAYAVEDARAEIAVDAR